MVAENESTVVSKRSFRVYFVTHGDGRRTGILMRPRDAFFDRPPPSAYGDDEESVLAQIEAKLFAVSIAGQDTIARYLWDEAFKNKSVRIEALPYTAIKKQPVVGNKRVPLRLTYVYSKTATGAYRVMLPRFGWWFIVEDLEVAGEVITHAMSSALLGESPRWMYDFRHEGPEYVREWSPASLTARAESGEDGTNDNPSEVMTAVAEEWVEKAAKKQLGLLIGDDSSFVAIEGLVQTFPLPSLLFVGPSGCGKTTQVRRLARLFRTWRSDKSRQHVPKIYATSADRIVAGMVYLGMWQQRCIDLVEELSFEDNYLFVDRLTGLMAPQPDGASIADLMATAVRDESLSLIAECTESELETCRRISPAFCDLFRIVRIPERSPADMSTLIALYQPKKKGAPQMHPAGIKRLVQHLDAFQRDVSFPGKGFRFIDWLAREGTEQKSVLYPADVSRAYARYSGLSVELIAEEQPARAEQIAERLARRVIGQKEACDSAGRLLARFKAGLNDPDRPLGSLFFVGPTGVGKTELAKRMAAYLFGDEKRLIRLDMSEYQAPGGAQRMLAVGRGINSLAEQVRQQPLSLVLLDEIEKAHSEVFDLLLGVLGEGRLTDSMGRLVDLRMTVIVMTSNLGASMKQAVGFGGAPGGDFMRSVRQHFRPELFNRIDRVISFSSLTPQDILRIVDLELDKAAKRTGLVRRNLQIRVTVEAKRLLAEIGYHKTFGARPLRRAIEELVVTPIAVMLAKDPALRDTEIAVVTKAAGSGAEVVVTA